jgi:DDE superfamily endonuclease
LKKSQKKRLQFARLHISKDQNFWNSILWSDESKFNIFGSDGRIRCWRKKNEALKMKNLNPTVKHNGGSVLIWGCLSSKGTGRHEFVEGIMNQYYYQGILSRNLVQSAVKLGLGRRFTFQQDNDPKHTAKTTSEYFTKNKIKLLPWPPQSPDLNPIEHLWDQIEREIRKFNISSKNDLKNRISEIWNMDPKISENLVNSMEKRLQAVIAAKGGPTSY